MSEEYPYNSQSIHVADDRYSARAFTQNAELHKVVTLCCGSAPCVAVPQDASIALL